MAPPRKRGKGSGAASSDRLEAYRRIRKPMPPPDQVIPDKHRKAEERDAKQAIRDAEALPADRLRKER
jgi:hypothetical protein